MTSDKDEKKSCSCCGVPITQEDYDEYKMCPWCYSQILIDSDYGNVL